MRCLVLLLFCCLTCRVLASGEITVTAHIVKTGHTKQGMPAFIVQAEVKNVSNTPLTLAMMSCGWDSCWRVEPKQVFQLRGIECDKNVVSDYVFLPGGGFTFSFCVETRRDTDNIAGQKVKVGFVVVDWRRVKGNIRNAFIFDEMRIQPVRDLPIVWSEWLTVPGIGLRELADEQERKELLSQK